MGAKGDLTKDLMLHPDSANISPEEENYMVVDLTEMNSDSMVYSGDTGKFDFVKKPNYIRSFIAVKYKNSEQRKYNTVSGSSLGFYMNQTVNYRYYPLDHKKRVCRDSDSQAELHYKYNIGFSTTNDLKCIVNTVFYYPLYLLNPGHHDSNIVLG